MLCLDADADEAAEAAAEASSASHLDPTRGVGGSSSSSSSVAGSATMTPADSQMPRARAAATAAVIKLSPLLSMPSFAKPSASSRAGGGAAAAAAAAAAGGGGGGLPRPTECLAHVTDVPAHVMMPSGLGTGGGATEAASGSSSEDAGARGMGTERRLRVVPRPPAIPSGPQSGLPSALQLRGGGRGTKGRGAADSFHFAIEVGRCAICPETLARAHLLSI